ncbi:MAG: rod shape-determining protein RodA [Candidatus Ryanbacteria bacterium]|nr:rod shape-determining protein RodA [Candidatus Ryanbacteria bacterium]
MKRLRYIDWFLVLAILPLLAFGLFTMKSLEGHDYYFKRQVLWIFLGFIVMGIFALIDWRSLKSGAFTLLLYGFSIFLLALLVIVGRVTRGAQSWFTLGSTAFEPVEIAKFSLILLLAKYFSGRYVEIALMRHIIISFLYVALPLILVIFQPDAGSAAILFFIWASMILFSGINLRQIMLLILVGVVSISAAWFFVLHPYQKARIIAFLQPEQDPRGSGYHAIQAMIAVGSGRIWGKGVGYGTQSRLNFLPESQTDFIFAAFAEEWGLLGVAFIFLSFALLFWRIIHIALNAPENFPKFVGLGVGFLLLGHILIHVGMNIGLLPITGIGLPFMSYGGSFLLVDMALLGLVESIALRSSIRAYEDKGVLVLTP